MLLRNILSSNLSGLSGKINLEGCINVPNSNSMPFRIINIVGKSYKELDFWKQDFDKPFTRESGDKINSRRNTRRVLEGPVI